MPRVTVVNGYNGQEKHIDYDTSRPKTFWNSCTEIFSEDIKTTINLAYDERGVPIPMADLSDLVDGSKVYVKSSSHYIDKHYSRQNQRNPENKFCNESVRMLNLGGIKVGKSAIAFRYMNDMFISDHDATLEDWYLNRISIDGIKVQLRFLDTRGMEEYRSDLESIIERENMDSILLIYDVTDNTSWDKLEEIHNNLQKEGLLHDRTVSVLGNKCDLPHSSMELSHQKESVNVWSENADTDIDFRVGSAKSNHQIQECFVHLIRQKLYMDYESIETPVPGYCDCYQCAIL